MFPKPLVIPALLAASVAVPYAATNGPEWAKDWSKNAKPPSALSGAASSSGSAADAQIQGVTAVPQGPNSTVYPTRTPIEGVPTYSIGQVMRMDVSKEWVYQRWARKSTSTSELNLFGVRVPLVTGTRMSDVAGSLTYYFGPDGVVHKLSFRGRTADTSQLIHEVARRYGLTRQPAPAGEQLYQLRRGADVISQLRTRPASVLWASSPHESFDVQLDLQRPDTGVPIVPSPVELPPEVTGATQAANSSGADAQSESSQASGSKEGEGANAKDKDGWKAFFPRSRVPKPQIESLDERRRMW